MRRVLCAVFALVMMFSLCVGASAAIVGVGNSEVGTVRVEVVGTGQETVTVYQVVLDWDSLTFTYDFGGGTRIWDPQKHGYTTADDGKAGWVNNSADITVTNHSNTALNVRMSFAGGGATKTTKGVTAALNNPVFTLATGEGRSFAEADTKTATVRVTGAPSEKADFNVGDIVIAISEQ